MLEGYSRVNELVDDNLVYTTVAAWSSQRDNCGLVIPERQENCGLESAVTVNFGGTCMLIEVFRVA